MQVVVFGAGSLGSLLGGLLARVHAVTLVGRDPHVSRIRTEGLEIETASGVDDPTVGSSLVVTPDATTDGTGLDADLAVATVKAYDTDAAARALATGSVDAALPLSNGMGNAEALAAHLDCPVLGGTTSYGAVLREPGVVEYRGRGDVVVGPRDPADAALADRVGAAFRAADLNARVSDDVESVLWEKLAVNAAINPTTALAGVDNGRALAAPLWSTARAAAVETAAAARTQGVELTDEAAVEAVERVAAATSENRSSMAQDLDAGRQTEIESICGHVVRTAEAAGTAAPVNRTLRSLVLAAEGRFEVREDTDGGDGGSPPAGE